MRWLARRSGAVITLALLATALLAVPFLAMQPEGFASPEPEGEVFAARDLAEERFVSRTYAIPVVVEARDGDLLRAEPLAELLANSAALRSDPELGPKLLTFFDPELGAEVHGFSTIADAVDAALRDAGAGGLATADDATVKAVAEEVIERAGPRTLRLSARSTQDASGWTVPAVSIIVLADDDAVGGPAAGATLGADDTTKEEFARDVLGRLRGDEVHSRAWTVGVDVNLTSAEQGQAAGPFIGFVIVGVLVIVGLTYRSYWPVALIGGALAALIVWLNGLSNLLGMERDQILSLIVPIAMISFGVDFAFHAVGRYREGLASGKAPRPALVAGLAGVLGALVLALGSDAAAFLANTVSGIQSIVQFGVAAALGLLSAFLMLGIVVPLALMRVDRRVGRPPRSRRTRLAAVFASTLAVAAATASVLFSVFIHPPVGVALLAAYIAVFLVVPYLLAGRGRTPVTVERARPPGRPSEAVAGAVGAVARHRLVALPAVAVLTAVCAYYAVQVPARFDVKDFFAPDSDFVVGLDKLDEHIADTGGEPALVYVEGDLASPRALEALRAFVDRTRHLETTSFARAEDDLVHVQDGVLGVIDDVVSLPAASAAVAETAGVAVRDTDGDGYPDTREQVRAIFDSALEIGVPLDERRPAWTPDDVGQVLWQAPNGGRQATSIELQLTGTRGQEGVQAAQAELAPLISELAVALNTDDSEATVVLTGAPIARQASLEAIQRALQVSLPIAIALCLLIAAAFMRSIRYALVSIVPIVLVVAWLYAFMYAFGYDVNLVTATIGAISIGIGIDFSIHVTMRYREELAHARTVDEALRATGLTTGVALATSALSSVVGFGILAFAPMPMFASYGLLTAVMIVMALVASLLVLPALLALVTPSRTLQPGTGARAARPFRGARGAGRASRAPG